ncbi:MAG: TlpA disulfide reductase family protein [Acidocella sp.]|nr:TlpA disulfide reductase family protein [Acidocella sp.]
MAQSSEDALPDAALAWTQLTPSAAPPLVFSADTAQKLTLADYKGHVLVVNIWATWCGPCTEELPSLAALAARIKPFGGLVLPVSIDVEGAAAVKPFFASHKIHNLPILLDPEGHNLDVLDTDGVPVTIVLDPSGKLVARLDGAADWNTQTVFEFLGGLAKPQGGKPGPVQL